MKRISKKEIQKLRESIRRIIDRGLLFNPVRITNVFYKMNISGNL